MQAESAPAEKVSEFCSITGSDAGRANFFLEAAGNDVNEAVNQYFAAGGGGPAAASSSSNTDTNELYVGGAGKQGGSGQNVIAPGSRRTNPDSDEIVKDMFKRAKEALAYST